MPLLRSLYQTLQTLLHWFGIALLEWSYTLVYYPTFLPVLWRLFEWSSFRSPYTAAEKSSNSFVSSSVELTYGEILLPTLSHIFQKYNLGEEDYFIDLGSGRGKVVLFAAIHNIPALGIEFVPELVEAACYASGQGYKYAQFVQGNFLKEELQQGTVFWLSGTCLKQDTRMQLCRKLQKSSKNAILFSVSVPLPGLPILEEVSAWTTWGRDRVYVQRVE